MKHTRLAAAIGAVAVATAGLGAGAAITTCGSSAQAPAAAATLGGSSYSYYGSMMGRLRGGSPGSMMGGMSYGWMMDGTGYRWMMGGLAAPAWMCGHALPGLMMGISRDPGKVMGRLWANAPGPRVSPGQATALGSKVPAGATVSRARTRSPSPAAASGSPSLPTRPAASMTGSASPPWASPPFVVKSGARVTIQVINADPDAAHGLVMTASDAGPHGCR